MGAAWETQGQEGAPGGAIGLATGGSEGSEGHREVGVVEELQSPPH